MPTPKSEFDRLHPCDFYAPAELLEPDRMYTVYEIARLLQGLDPDAELEESTEAVLLDWAIPWVVDNQDALVVADPRDDEEPGYYGLKTDDDLDGEPPGETPPASDGDSTNEPPAADDGDSTNEPPAADDGDSTNEPPAADDGGSDH